MVDVLIIEDNVELSSILSDFLLEAGYSVFLAASGEEGLQYLTENPVKLLLLDIMLPALDGFAVCKIAREKHNLPIIIMSAKHGDNNKIIGLELGADDYLEKPFSVNLLLAKVKSHLRRSYHMADNKQLLSVGDLTIDPASMNVYLRNEPVTMTAKEYELLLLLIKNKGKALRKEWLFDKVWGIDSFSELSTLTVHISKLREKIELNPKEPKRIVTVWGVGYKYETI